MKEFKLGKYVNPLTDYGFKHAFFTEENKKLLIDFLQKLTGEKIKGLRFLPSIQNENTSDKRRSVFDVFCETDEGYFVILEMQKAKQPHFIERCLYYLSVVTQRQAKRGRWNFDLQKVYFIGILDFNLFKEKEADKIYFEKVKLIRKYANLEFSNQINPIFVELPKFTKKEEELTTERDKWLFLLKNMGEMKEQPVGITGKIFDELFEAMEVKHLNETEMETYKKSILEYQDVRDAVDLALREGREEGELRGKLDGLREGLQKASVQTAKNLLSMGMSVDLISQATGLSEEEIEKLK